MHRWILSFVTALTLLGGTAQAQSQADLDKVAKLLEEGAEKFVAMVDKVTDEQWDFRVPGITHTLGEEIEHVSLSESDLQKAVDRAMQSPAKPGAEDPAKYEEIREVLLGADARAENFKGQNKIVNRSEYEEFFPAANQRLMVKLRSTPNLSDHFYRTRVLGEMSGLQLFYYIAYHRERHMRQMEALLSHPDMPGSRVSAD